MKRTAILLLLSALLTVSASAQSFSGLLNGAHEVPGPGDPDGTGIAVVTISGTTINYTVFTQNIGAPTEAHIHRGAAGTDGSPVVDLNVNTLLNGSAAGVSQTLIDEILANPSGFYVDVDTAEFPNGAIRGQLVATGGTGEGTRTSFIPVIGKVTGANDTNFVTDLRIVNNGSATANVTLDFFTQSPSGHAAPTTSKNVSVLPGEQRVLNDVAGLTLEQSGVLGALRITSDQNIVASARIINDLRTENEGTAGFAIDATETGETSGTILFLANSGDYRTNLGYFNSSSTPATVTLTARSSAGAVLGTNTLTIPGFAMVQQPVFNAISSVPQESRTQDDFYVTWTSNAPLFVYGAVTDNQTGDAVLNQ